MSRELTRSVKDSHIFFEDDMFNRSVKKALRPYVRNGRIVQLDTTIDRLFVHVAEEFSNPYCLGKQTLHEFTHSGVQIAVHDYFSKIPSYTCGSISVNNTHIFIFDSKAPANLYVGNSLNKLEELAVGQRRLYIISRNSGKLEEVGLLVYPVSNLTADNDGRLYGMCGKTWDIVKLVRQKVLEESSVDNSVVQTSFDMVPNLKLSFFGVQKIFDKQKSWVLEPLMRTLDDHIILYDRHDKSVRGVNCEVPEELYLDADEKENMLRSASDFVFLKNFMVCKIYEYFGSSPPYRKQLSFKGIAYASDEIFTYKTKLMKHTFAFGSMRPLLGDSFVQQWDNRTIKKIDIKKNHKKGLTQLMHHFLQKI